MPIAQRDHQANHISLLQEPLIGGTDLSTLFVRQCGTGFDTVKLDASTTGQTLDLSSVKDLAVKGIESIDLTNGVANTVALNVRDLLNIHDEGGQAGGVINRLLIKGEAGDTVNRLTTYGTWSAAGTEVVNSVTYNVYTNSLDTVDKLLVQQGVTVV